MYGTSKFEYGRFYDWPDEWFAVNAQKYTEEEAIAIFQQEMEEESTPYKIGRAAVIWRVGYNEDGERCAGWWLDLTHDGTEPRYCPVWLFQWH